MIFAVMILLCAGIFLSAFFSGNETGFYRVSRLRLVIKALGGDQIARGLLWLANNPSLFVATTLVGNNLANYVTSLAIILLVQRLPVLGNSTALELLTPIVFAPLLFVYGELLPKYLYYHAPHAMLRRGGPLFLLFTFLFFPIAALLWLFGRLLQKLVGEAPEGVRLKLARSELSHVFAEGQHAGVLSPAQHRLAQGLFSAASSAVKEHCTPAGRVVAIARGAAKRDVFRLARRQRQPALPVEERKGGERRLVGYVRIIDLHREIGEQVDAVRPLIEVSEDESFIAALIRLESSGELLARVVNADGDTVGLLNVQSMSEPLFRAN